MTDLVKAEKPHNSITQLMTVAQMLADGEMFNHPSKRPLRVGEVFSIVEYGREVGLEPVMALQNISIVNGRLCMGGAVMLGIAKQHGVKEEFLTETKEECEVKFEREGFKPYTAKFTMEDAKKIKVKSGMYLADKDVWKNYPAEMLKWRAVAKGLRVIAADVLAGLYLPEEIDSIAEAEFDYTSPPKDAKKEHFDQKKNGFLDDDAPVISPVSEGQVGDPYPPKDEKKESVDLITDNQLRAYHAISGSWNMKPFEKPFKTFLFESGIIDQSYSTKSMPKDRATHIISNYGDYYRQFLCQEHLHPECKEIVKMLDRGQKIVILEQINNELTKPIDLTTIDFDADVSDHYSLLVLALQNQLNNKIAEKVNAGGITAEEAINELEELGMDPTVVESVDLHKEQPKKQDSFL